MEKLKYTEESYPIELSAVLEMFFMCVVRYDSH